MMSRISGNQTNNSEQPNASVSSATATDLASTTTTSAAAAAYNSKQRKKRKKKKDISLTNQAVSCSCGKRIESSCNSVSTCSNCVPTACVYCHFNDLAYRENYFSEHSSPSRFQGNFYDLNIKKSAPFGFWPHKIENNDNGSGAIVRVTADSNNYFMRQQHQQQRNITTLNRRTEQLQRFAVYENLCEFCGFAIGNGAYHQHCDTSNSKRNSHTTNREQDNDEQQQKPEHIYENICESCRSLFDGEQCTGETCIRNKNSTTPQQQSVPITSAGEVIDVLVKKPPIANNNRQAFGKQFSEFLGSFRQRLTPKTSASETTERKKPKIEIIHNTNDEVFKTNKTFDLNEIVQLRNQSLCSDQPQQQQHKQQQRTNTCSELINGSDEIVCREVPPSKPIRLFRASNSDSNFFENYHLSPPHFQSPYSESIVSDTILYSNSYAPPSYEDAIQHSKYASVRPFKLRARIKPTVYDSTSASSFFTYDSSSVSTLQSHSLAGGERKSPNESLSLFDDADDSVKLWLISLKRQPNEYTDDSRQFECGSTKCLPSKMLNESATKLKWSIEHGDSMNMSSNVTGDGSQSEILRRIELFKENLMEHRMHSKRNAIYIKDSICDVTIDPDAIAPDIETTTMTTANNVQSSSSLLPSSYCHRNGSDSAIDENRMENFPSREQMNQVTYLSSTNYSDGNNDDDDRQQHINHNIALEITSQYLQMLKTFYMEQVTLSTSLNRIVLVCGDRRVNFLLKFLVSQPQSSLQYSKQLVQPAKYTDLQQIIELIHKMGIKKQLGECDIGKAINESVEHRLTKGRRARSAITNAFLMRSANLVLRTPLRARYKRSIDDFVKRKYRRRPSIIDAGTVKKTFDDFSKLGAKDSNICGKSLNDFTVKKTDYSSPTTITTKVTDTACVNKATRNQIGNKVKRKDSSKRNEENIYQPIWMFKTIGTAVDTPPDDEDSLNNFDTCQNESDDTTVHDANEWEIAQEEFLFSSQRIDSVHHSNVTRPTIMISHTADSEIEMPKVDANNSAQCNMNEKPLYQTICVLYSNTNPKWNEIIYDYNGNSMKFSANTERNNMDEGSESNCCTTNANGSNKVEKQSANLCNEQGIAIKLDSVNAWKSMLRTVDYIDDEEDVILSESYLLHQKSAEYNNQNNDNLQSAQSDESVSDTTKSSIQSDKTEETDLSSDVLSVNSSTPSTSPTATNESKSKKESGFLNKLQYNVKTRFDVAKGNSKKDEHVQGLHYKNLNGKMHAESSPPMEIKRLNHTGTTVFGATLEDVEKDDKLTDIPKFVVECIKVIEVEENLRTNGIYRASGKKDSIDKLRKRMNESKLRKGTKYVSLKDEDVHTITGALKQFFRELKTELISEDIVKNLPNDLESEASLASIRDGISTIDYLSRETLKYLLQHLIRVDANREYNLMNATNLSIVWGASLFTSSVSITNAFETSDLLRRNLLIKVLIQRYDDIFIDTDRLI